MNQSANNCFPSCEPSRPRSLALQGATFGRNKKLRYIFWYWATPANDLKDSKRAKGNQKNVFCCKCVCVVVQGSECLIAVHQKITLYSSNRFVSAHGWSSGLRHGLALRSGVVRAPNSLAKTIYRATSRGVQCLHTNVIPNSPNDVHRNCNTATFLLMQENAFKNVCQCSPPSYTTKLLKNT